MTDEEKKEAAKLRKNARSKTWRNSHKEEMMTYNKVWQKAIEERKIKDKAYKRTIDGLISRIYYSQKGSSKRREHNPPTYSKEQLHVWMTSQVNFNNLYINWVASGYKKDLVPSVDRLDDYKGYSFDNIQLMTWRENLDKYNNRNK